MFQTFLLLFTIYFLTLLSRAFVERSRLYKKYPISCDVVYIPKKEKISGIP